MNKINIFIFIYTMENQETIENILRDKILFKALISYKYK